MNIYKTAKYQVKPEAIEVVVKAMHNHATYLKEHFPKMQWWTVRDSSDPFSFMTLIILPDEETNQKASKSPGTKEFVDILYSNIESPVEWANWSPIAYSSELF